jgi:predicted Zn-dependent protease
MRDRKVAILITTLMILTLLLSSGCFESDSSPPVLGDYAKAYLQDKKYTRLIVEVDYVEGYSPTPSVLDTLRERIDRYCDKEDIPMDTDSIPKTQSSYSLDDIKALEKEYKDFVKTRSDIVVYILYLNGFYSDNSNVLGVAYGPGSVAIFKEKIDDINIPPGAELFIDSSDYEKSVVVHEMGHLLALVNIGYKSEADHESTNAHHCKFDDCVMYYKIETVSIYDLITQENPEPPSDFCQDCRNDLTNLKRDVY